MDKGMDRLNELGASRQGIAATIAGLENKLAALTVQLHAHDGAIEERRMCIAESKNAEKEEKTEDEGAGNVVPFPAPDEKE